MSAIGRRNYVFAGSHAGAALASSVCATCNLVGINPVEYLGDGLPRLARGVADEKSRRRSGPAIATLMPAAWKAAHATRV